MRARVNINNLHFDDFQIITQMSSEYVDTLEETIDKLKLRHQKRVEREDLRRRSGEAPIHRQPDRRHREKRPRGLGREHRRTARPTPGADRRGPRSDLALGSLGQ